MKPFKFQKEQKRGTDVLDTGMLTSIRKEEEHLIGTQVLEDRT